MKKEHFYVGLLIALFFAVLSPVLQDMGYTFRIATFIREKVGQMPINIDDILGRK